MITHLYSFEILTRFTNFGMPFSKQHVSARCLHSQGAKAAFIELIFALLLTTSGWLAESMAQQNKSSGEVQASDVPVDVKTQLVVRNTQIERSAFPVVDIHTHFFIKGKHDADLLDQYVAMMDRNNIAVCISLDGTLWKRLDDHETFLSKYSDRFVLFANIDFQGEGDSNHPETWSCNQPGFVRHVITTLRESKARIGGLKFFKDFGLRFRNSDGSWIAIDDPRWDPIWQTCGELGLPVLIHTADPAAFFEPITAANERFGELKQHPEWSFSDPKFPKRASLHEARNRVIARHPHTTFIAAHFANDAEDLEQLSTWLDSFPNMYVEFASRLNELGRQPYSARRFFEKHQDRILFGTDGPWPESRIKLYWRFLQTWDEYFPYSEKVPPPQGNWRIYGIGLDPIVLQKVYFQNASKIIPGVRERLSKYREQRGH